jgi:hypothetical protein
VVLFLINYEYGNEEDVIWNAGRILFPSEEIGMLEVCLCVEMGIASSLRDGK